MEVNLNQLVNLTGMAYRTVKKRLSGLKPIKSDQAGIYYNSKEALPILFGVGGDEGFDLSKERARLAKLQGDAQDLKNKLTRGEIVHADQVKNNALKTGVMIRTLLETIGNKVAPVLVDLDAPAAIADVINREINQVLSKLSDEIKRV